MNLAVTAAGSIVVWGVDYESAITDAPLGTGHTVIGAGTFHYTALSEVVGTGYCFGDGTGLICPCAADGAEGEGCANSTGSGVELTGSGSFVLGDDQLVLHVVGAPAAVPGLLLRGDDQVSTVVGDGILCTAGNSQRSHVQVTSGGLASFDNFLGAPFGNFSNIGAPTNFQFWYRDPQNTCTGAGLNFSNGLSVIFQP